MALTIVCKRAECPRYQRPIKPVEEFHDHVLYVCEICGAARLITKDICGGTRGAGKAGTKEAAIRGVQRR